MALAGSAIFCVSDYVVNILFEEHPRPPNLGASQFPLSHQFFHCVVTAMQDFHCVIHPTRFHHSPHSNQSADHNGYKSESLHEELIR